MNKILLINLQRGTEAKIISISGGRTASKRLADLGLTPGTKIKLLRRAPFGPVEVDVRGSKLVLGRGLAVKIQVKINED